MLPKIIVLVILGLIIYSLGSALFHMYKGNGEEGSDRMLKALTRRIILTVSLLILLIIMGATGLIKPHGLMPVQPQATSSTPAN